MQKMKALILAGGRGNRINEFSENQNKCMIHLNGKPLLQHSLEKISEEDISEIVMVVGYKAEQIINHFGISFRNKRIKYVIQWEQRGLVHAIECAKNELDGQDFVLMLGDEIMSGSRLSEMIRFYREEKNIFGVCGILKVENREQIRRTYTLVKGDNGQIFRLIEKPRKPFNNYQGTGHCIFNHQILDYIDITPIHHERNEKELPDLVQCCIDEGHVVKAFDICDEYGNVNSIEDLKRAEKWIITTA